MKDPITNDPFTSSYDLCFDKLFHALARSETPEKVTILRDYPEEIINSYCDISNALSDCRFTRQVAGKLEYDMAKEGIRLKKIYSLMREINDYCDEYGIEHMFSEVSDVYSPEEVLKESEKYYMVCLEQAPQVHAWLEELVNSWNIDRRCSHV